MSPDDLFHVIRSRRSSLLIDPAREVDKEIVAQLCETVQWAPNHKKTWPAQLAVFTGDARNTLGATLAAVMQEQNEDPHKVEKTRTKYLRAPVIIAAASERGDSNERTRENAYSVAAGIQNMLLLAHQIGLACLWGSPPRGSHHALTHLCDFTEQSDVLGLIYIGWPTQIVPPVDRPPMRITYLS
jgi:nitroreductase